MMSLHILKQESDSIFDPFYILDMVWMMKMGIIGI